MVREAGTCGRRRKRQPGNSYPASLRRERPAFPFAGRSPFSLVDVLTVPADRDLAGRRLTAVGLNVLSDPARAGEDEANRLAYVLSRVRKLAAAARWLASNARSPKGRDTDRGRALLTRCAGGEGVIVIDEYPPKACRPVPGGGAQLRLRGRWRRAGSYLAVAPV